MTTPRGCPALKYVNLSHWWSCRLSCRSKTASRSVITHNLHLCCCCPLLRVRTVKTLESPEIKLLSCPRLESPRKGIAPGNPFKSPGNFTFRFKCRSIEKKFIVTHCVYFVTCWVNLDFGNTFIVLLIIAFGLVYCNAVTSKTDLVCAVLTSCLWMECILESLWKRIFEF